MKPYYGWTNITAAKPLITLGIRENVHSRHEIRIWEDLWIPIQQDRLDPLHRVVHSMMPISQLMTGNPKRWNLEILENYVNQEDIPLNQSLAISHDYHRDKYCWNYTKNGMFTVKLGYWVAMNFLRVEAQEVQETSITKLQTFAWKIKAPSKTRHFIWQTISRQLAVTNNLTHHHM